jgi:hypothetical protein
MSAMASLCRLSRSRSQYDPSKANRTGVVGVSEPPSTCMASTLNSMLGRSLSRSVSAYQSAAVSTSDGSVPCNVPNSPRPKSLHRHVWRSRAKQPHRCLHRVKKKHARCFAGAAAQPPAPEHGFVIVPTAPDALSTSAPSNGSCRKPRALARCKHSNIFAVEWEAGNYRFTPTFRWDA